MGTEARDIESDMNVSERNESRLIGRRRRLG
jgi:hypothetical protein